MISFLQSLISLSASINHVSEQEMKSRVKVMATGGGAHKYYDMLKSELGVEVSREDEMECLITGLSFITCIPDEVFWYSDELVYEISHPPKDGEPHAVPAAVPAVGTDGAKPALPRPSPDPPMYQVTFDTSGTPQFPCLLVNIGSGVSIVKVDEDGSFERVSGTSVGGGTLWGLLSLLTDANSFDGASSNWLQSPPHPTMIF
jgi:type II pantothenate kinase